MIPPCGCAARREPGQGRTLFRLQSQCGCALPRPPAVPTIDRLRRSIVQKKQGVGMLLPAPLLFELHFQPNVRRSGQSGIPCKNAPSAGTSNDEKLLTERPHHFRNQGEFPRSSLLKGILKSFQLARVCPAKSEQESVSADAPARTTEAETPPVDPALRHAENAAVKTQGKIEGARGESFPPLPFCLSCLSLFLPFLSSSVVRERAW